MDTVPLDVSDGTIDVDYDLFVAGESLTTILPVRERAEYSVQLFDEF
jgi:hypothetical protein